MTDWDTLYWLMMMYHAEWMWVYQHSNPANDAVKQRTSYLFGKEDIHQAMLKDKVKPIWCHLR